MCFTAAHIGPLGVGVRQGSITVHSLLFCYLSSSPALAAAFRWNLQDSHMFKKDGTKQVDLSVHVQFNAF